VNIYYVFVDVLDTKSKKASTHVSFFTLFTIQGGDHTVERKIKKIDDPPQPWAGGGMRR
jgi:hypothetical protein